ncbi:hypothetical protein EUX98_g7551 [Antrodiella citrinella]|uniref:Uncharacterized protein n=1 Tax=Antrodiella citrinella TaxID=2447956 RepID=A0A4S4ML89_9APHY|nr:hypothetical protein EUX98_g7551 [Antrodiella citrinella]
MPSTQDKTKTADPDCLVRLHEEWNTWYPGNVVGSEVVKYPHSSIPETPIYLVEFKMGEFASPERGWFNPLLGTIWWPRRREPTLTYHESMAVHREQTKVLVPIKSSVVVAGQLGVFDVYYQAQLQPDGMGEEILEKGIEVLEGLYQGMLSDPVFLDRVVPNTQVTVDKLLKLGGIFWDNRQDMGKARYAMALTQQLR